MGHLRPSFTPAGDPSTPKPHTLCPAPAPLPGPTLSAWASRDFKLLVTIFSSSSRSPHLLHPKQGPPGGGTGPGGQERVGGSRKSRCGEGGKKEKEQVERGENSAQVEKEQSRCERELPGRIRSSVPRASSHGRPVHHCRPGSCWPHRAGEQARRDGGACPACARRSGRRGEVGGGGSGAERREVAGTVQETATEKGGLLHIAPRP